MGDIGTVARQHKTMQHAGESPFCFVEDAVLLLQYLRHKVEREVGTQNGHSTTLRVADGTNIGHKGRLGILTVEEGFRPVGRVSGDGSLKPFGTQVVIIGTTQLSGHHRHTVRMPGVRTKPSPLLGIVVVNETDAATAYTGVLCDDALHDGLHLVRLLQVTLNVEEVVLDGYRHIRH